MPEELVVTGKNASGRVLAALAAAFPKQTWRSALGQKEIVVVGKNAYARVTEALRKAFDPNEARDEKGEWATGAYSGKDSEQRYNEAGLTANNTIVPLSKHMGKSDLFHPSMNKLFDHKVGEVKVPLSSLRSVQDYLNPHQVAEYRKPKSEQPWGLSTLPIATIRVGDERVIADGTHRVAAALLNGEKTATVADYGQWAKDSFGGWHEALEKGEGPGHPFRGNQYGEGSGGASTPVPDRAKQDEAIAYLKTMSEQISQMTKGKGFDAILAEHGKGYYFDAKSFSGTARTAHRCFEMAAKRALDDPKMTYVEGHVSVHGVPIHHAWVVDSAGRVHEPTIKDGKGVLGYLGVPVQSQYLMHTLVRTKVYGVFDWQNRAVFDDKPENYVKKFNPSEARDERGRWSVGSGAAPEGTLTDVSRGFDIHPETAMVRARAEGVATKLGFDNARISVKNGPAPQFTLNGMQYAMAGRADLKAGTITLYNTQLTSDTVGGVTAHEIMHQKFEDVLKAYAGERDKMMADPETAWHRSTDGKLAGMRADGSLTPELARKYPLYQIMQQHLDINFEELKRSDGFTDYSKDWWKAFKAGGIESKFPVHETLAEIARVDYEGGSLRDSTASWRKFYRDVRDYWDLNLRKPK
jgi:hypothetical protein